MPLLRYPCDICDPLGVYKPFLTGESVNLVSLQVGKGNPSRLQLYVREQARAFSFRLSSCSVALKFEM